MSSAVLEAVVESSTERAADSLGIDEAHEAFRNELASVAPDGRRRWIYARRPSGRLYRWRTLLSWGLLAFLLLAPFVRVGGLPLMLFDVLNRRFVLLGVLFWPQDFYLVVLIALGVIVTLVLSTATVGRVWCGWLCPQTIFMEMLFRKIEFLIDGSAEQQVRRHRGPWTAERLARTGLKHAIFVALSFLIANVFLAYIIGDKELWRIVTDPPRQHLAGLLAIIVFSLVFYAVFARFREQACVLACPYGRVMSSLIDRSTITVTYDSRRGEPRGRLVPHTRDRSDQGDCIDCHQCVTVCPTGIDIRNGVQLECVNCTACIDACNDVMRRISKPEGLIRLTSHDAVLTGRLHWWTARVTAYASVWVVLVATVTVLVARRPTLDVLVLRQPGTMFTTLPSGEVVNFYNVQVFNRTSRRLPFEIVAVAPAGTRVTPLGDLSAVEPHALLEGRLLLTMPAERTMGTGTPVGLDVRQEGRTVQHITSSFIGPARTASGG